MIYFWGSLTPKISALSDNWGGVQWPKSSGSSNNLFGPLRLKCSAERDNCLSGH